MLTKSAFLAFQQCRKSFWLAARRPDVINVASPSAFDQRIMADGYEVERAFREYVGQWPDAANVTAQTTWATADLSARADFVRKQADNSIDIFEVKGSTSLKAYYVADAAFQAIVAERTGLRVNTIHIAHLNRNYVRQGPLDLASLFNVVEITADVAARRTEIEQQIEEALALLGKESIDEVGCGCIYFGSPEKRCAGFDHLNRDIPEQSIYVLPRLSAAKVKTFVDSGRLALGAVAPAELTPRQRLVQEAAAQGAPVIDRSAIREFLGGITWPIHFYDYETCNPLVPVADGHWPARQIPVQYSLHILNADDSLEHHECLSMGHGMERELVESLKQRIGKTGSAMVWFQAFETTRNRELGEAMPDQASFFEDLNSRTIDLMKPFESAYVDIRFEGSASIKKVLPVLCPDLRYDKDAVHDGTGAIEAWTRMVASTDACEKQKLADELLAYCKLDTFAMVEIFRFLQRLVG